MTRIKLLLAVLWLSHFSLSTARDSDRALQVVHSESESDDSPVFIIYLS